MPAAGSTNLSQGSTEVGPPLQEESMFHTIAGVMGNLLEWYDFALFGFFSDIISQVFFPESDSDTDNLIQTFVIFGGAFLMRPLGGILIGYVGDKHGRKQALTKSLFLMAIPTTAMGFLPSYERAGWLATALLCLCRLAQGISVGGQLPASLVYTVEKRHASQWGYYGSLPMTAANCGTLLGNLVGAFLRTILTEDQLLSWGWRIPFFSGFLIALVAWWIRKHGHDVHTNAGHYDSEDAEIKNPLTKALAKENRLALLSSSLVPMLWGSGFYISFVWMAVFMSDLIDNPIENAFWVNAMSMLFGMTAMLPLAGKLSDRIGRVKVMTFSAGMICVLGPIMVVLIAGGNPFLAFLGQLVLGIFLSGFGGPLCAWLVESYSPEVRLTSASLGYDISHALAAGFSPALATVIFVEMGPNGVGLLYPVFGVISIFGLYVVKCCGGSTYADQQQSSDLELQQNVPKDDTDLPEVS